jgi:hypothetical protein
MTPTCEAARVARWIYFLHPPRENFAATMTEDEQAVWSDAARKVMESDPVIIRA